MQLEPVIQRLRQQAPSLAHVAGGVSLAALKSVPSRTPAAFVLPVSEQAGPNTSGTLEVNQRIVRRFAVIVVVRDVRDATGEAAYDGGLSQARGEIDAALVGWAPEPGAGLVTRAGGRLLSFSSGALWWQDEFESEIWQGGTP